MTGSSQQGTATASGGIDEVVLVASGDLRETANRLGWPAQATLEKAVEAAFERHGVRVRRGPSVRLHDALGDQRSFAIPTRWPTRIDERPVRQGFQRDETMDTC